MVNEENSMKVTNTHCSDYESAEMRMTISATIAEWRDMKRCLEFGSPATFKLSIIIDEMISLFDERNDHEKYIFPEGTDNSYFAHLLDVRMRGDGNAEDESGVERGGDGADDIRRFIPRRFGIGSQTDNEVH